MTLKKAIQLLSRMSSDSKTYNAAIKMAMSVMEEKHELLNKKPLTNREKMILALQGEKDDDFIRDNICPSGGRMCKGICKDCIREWLDEAEEEEADR